MCDYLKVYNVIMINEDIKGKKYNLIIQTRKVGQKLFYGRYTV